MKFGMYTVSQKRPTVDLL